METTVWVSRWELNAMEIGNVENISSDPFVTKDDVPANHSMQELIKALACHVSNLFSPSQCGHSEIIMGTLSTFK